MPRRAFEQTQVLQHLEANDIRVPRKVASELRAEAGIAEGARQSIRFENTDVRFRQHVWPMDKSLPVRPRIPGGVEEEPAWLQESADAAQNFERIFHMFQNFDRGDDIEGTSQRGKFIFP